MYIKHITVGEIQTNCYAAGGSDGGECLVIDPGGDADKIADAVAADGRVIKAILLTHGHYDHIGAVSALRERFGVKVYAGEHERELLGKPEINLSVNFGSFLSEKADIYINDGCIIEEAGIKLKVIETPGHTAGGVCYYSEECRVLFSGDTLFEMSVGRTDFPTSSSAALVRSIREKLFVLPDDVTVYPGHGPATDIGFEKSANMYV